MNVVKTSTQLFNQLVEFYRIKDERQRRDRAISAAIVLFILVVLYYFLT